MVFEFTLVAHVFFAALAFGFAIVADFVLSGVAASRDPRAIRVAYGWADRRGFVLGPLFGLTLILGFVLALERGESLLAPWLLITYLLVGCGAITGIFFNRPRAQSILAAAAASDDQTPSSELLAAIGNARPGGSWILIALLALLITVMFLKPFS